MSVEIVLYTIEIWSKYYKKDVWSKHLYILGPFLIFIIPTLNAQMTTISILAHQMFALIVPFLYNSFLTSS